MHTSVSSSTESSSTVDYLHPLFPCHEMLVTQTVRIPAGKHVRANLVVHIPPGKRDQDLAIKKIRGDVSYLSRNIYILKGGSDLVCLICRIYLMYVPELCDMSDVCGCAIYRGSVSGRELSCKIPIATGKFQSRTPPVPAGTLTPHLMTAHTRATDGTIRRNASSPGTRSTPRVRILKHY